MFNLSIELYFVSSDDMLQFILSHSTQSQPYSKCKGASQSSSPSLAIQVFLPSCVVDSLIRPTVRIFSWLSRELNMLTVVVRCDWLGVFWDMLDYWAGYLVLCYGFLFGLATIGHV